MISERARYLRSAEIQYSPSKIWPGEYSSGLEKYEKTFSSFGVEPIRQILENRRQNKLKTTMFDIAASGGLIKELLLLKLIDLGISFTLVDPRRSRLVKINDLLKGSILRIGDIVDSKTFTIFPIKKAQVITFRHVGAFDDYPESEFVEALSNVIKCLDPKDGVLFAQFPSAGPDKNKGNRIMGELNLDSKWDVKIIEDGYRRMVNRGYHFENAKTETYPTVRIKSK